VGKVKYRKEERGVFTAEELRRLFPDHGYGPWRDIQDCTCFYLAAVTGLRRGEVLALRWQHIDFDAPAWRRLFGSPEAHGRAEGAMCVVLAVSGPAQAVKGLPAKP
jgi:integrase